MSTPDFIHELLGDHDIELAQLVTYRYQTFPLIDFLTFLLSLKDRRPHPDERAIRLLLDQVGEEAIRRSPAARDRQQVISQLLSLPEEQLDAVLAASQLEADPLLLEMLAFNAEKFLDAPATQAQAKRAMSLSVKLAQLDDAPLAVSISQYQFGVVLMKLGEVHEAVAVLEPALDGMVHHHPAGARTVRIYLAIAYQAAGRSADAYTQYNILLPDARESTRGSLMQNLAQLGFDLGMLGEASDYAREAVALLVNPAERASLALTRGFIERRLGNLEAAELALEEALAYYRAQGDRIKLAQVLNALYLVYQSQGRLTEAQEVLDEAAMLVAGEDNETSVSVHLNKGMAALKQGNLKAAQNAFQDAYERAQRADDLLGQAKAAGNLGAVFLQKSDEEPTPYLMEALRRFTELNRPMERAEVLMNLAYRESVYGFALQTQGLPTAMLAPFRRAERYTQQAIEALAESGDHEGVVRGYLNLARIYRTLDWQPEALDAFQQALATIEDTWLDFVEEMAGTTYVQPYAIIYAEAIQLAVTQQQPALAFRLCEQFKSRHFLQHLGRSGPISTALAAVLAPDVAAQEEALLTNISEIYTALQQARGSKQRNLKADLLNHAEQLQALYDRLAETPELEEYLAIRQGRPLDNRQVAALLGDRPASAGPDAAPEAEAVPERFLFDTAGRITCPQCQTDNRIESTYCSICEARLPRSRSVNFDALLDPQTLSQDEATALVADTYYDRALRHFQVGEFALARDDLRHALSMRPHPDYYFFLGWSYLGLGEPAAALAAFEEVLTLQFRFRYPFYPLPLPPPALREAVTMLDDPDAAETGYAVFTFLTEQFNRHYAHS